MKLNVYNIFDRPGDFNKVLLKPFDLLIDNVRKFSSPIEVVIPTFKRKDLLLKAIYSALDQKDCEKFLITVLDDDPHSSTELYDMLINYKDSLRYIRNKDNLGMFNNWNRALQIANAPYIALLHDDDLLEPDYISRLTKVLSLNSNIGTITHTPYQLVNNEKLNPFSSIKMKIKRGLIAEVNWRDYLFGNVTNASAMLINKEMGIQLGGWQSSEFPSADYFFNARMAYRFNVMNYFMPLSTYRWEANASLQKDVVSMFAIADSWFILSTINSKPPISKILMFLAEISVYQRIESIENFNAKSIPGSHYIVERYKHLNKYSLLVLRVLRRLYFTFIGYERLFKSKRII